MKNNQDSNKVFYKKEDFTLQILLEDWLYYIKQMENDGMIIPVMKRIQDEQYTNDDSNLKICCREKLTRKIKHNRMLLDFTMPYLAQLNNSLLNMPHFIIISDSECLILNVLGTPEKFGGEKNGIAPGFYWNEQNNGKNALAGALHSKNPILYYGIKRYNIDGFHSLSSLAVKLENETGETIGAINISIPTEYSLPQYIYSFITTINLIQYSLIKNIQEIKELDFDFVGENIKRVRKEKGFLQEDLAKKADLSQFFISKIENNETSPTLRSLELIAAALDIKVNKLI